VNEDRGSKRKQEGRYWREIKKSLRSMRATVIRSRRPRFPTEALSGN